MLLFPRGEICGERRASQRRYAVEYKRYYPLGHDSTCHGVVNESSHLLPRLPWRVVRETYIWEAQILWSETVAVYWLRPSKPVIVGVFGVRSAQPETYHVGVVDSNDEQSHL